MSNWICILTCQETFELFGLSLGDGVPVLGSTKVDVVD